MRQDLTPNVMAGLAWYYLLAAMLNAAAAAYVAFTLDSAMQYWRGRGGYWKGRVQAPMREAGHA